MAESIRREIRYCIFSEIKSEWLKHDPVLLDGELGLEKDTNEIKIGDGASRYSELPYVRLKEERLIEDLISAIELRIEETGQKGLTAGDNIDITGDIISAVDTIYNDSGIKADVAKKQDKLVAGANVQIDDATNTMSATDTITTINGKTGAISKADIVALGIPSQDTVYDKPASEPISYIQGLQAELDSKVESYGTNPVLNIAVINVGGSTTGIPNNTLILELE